MSGPDPIVWEGSTPPVLAKFVEEDGVVRLRGAPWLRPLEDADPVIIKKATSDTMSEQLSSVTHYIPKGSVSIRKSVQIGSQVSYDSAVKKVIYDACEGTWETSPPVKKNRKQRRAEAAKQRKKKR